MKMAWKEMKKFKLRYLILGFIVFLISVLTLSISGLANGLSDDNASLIKHMPDGTFYMDEEAEDNYSFSSLTTEQEDEFKNASGQETFFSIQMGELLDDDDKKFSTAYVTSEGGDYFPEVDKGEIVLDSSFEGEGFEVGDEVSNSLMEEPLTIAGFVEQQKFSHTEVGFTNKEDYGEMFRADTFQIGFIDDEVDLGESLKSYNNSDFLNTIPSYSAEQMSLNMIIIFLYVISALLFAIFFYMINVQKMSTFGILKAIGVKQSSLFVMMWSQMLLITIVSLIPAIVAGLLINQFAREGMPFFLPTETITFSAIAFIIIGFLGATLSGLQIRKAEPMQAINQGGM